MSIRPPIKPGKRTPGGLSPKSADGAKPVDKKPTVGRNSKKGRAGTKVRIGGGPHPTGPRNAQRSFTKRSDASQVLHKSTRKLAGNDQRRVAAAKTAKRPTKAQGEIKTALAVRKAVQAAEARRRRAGPKKYTGPVKVNFGGSVPNR